MAFPNRPPGGPAPAQPRPQKTETQQWSKWEGVNVRDARMAIGDTELAWMENAITIGAGRIELLPSAGDPIATILETQAATLWGVVFGTTELLIAICANGSIQQIDVAS